MNDKTRPFARRDFGLSASNKPVRKVVRPTGTAFRGKFPSSKNDRPIAFESLLERDALFLFEFSRGIASYGEQPLFTFYLHGGKMRKYTPDFKITLVSGKTRLIEVKPAYKLNDPIEADRLSHVERHFASHGTPFQIISEKQIRRHSALLANLKILLPFRFAPFSRLDQRIALERAQLSQPTPLDEISARLKSHTVALQLVAHHALSCNLNQPLTAKSVLHFVDTEACDDHLLF